MDLRKYEYLRDELFTRLLHAARCVYFFLCGCVSGWRAVCLPMAALRGMPAMFFLTSLYIHHTDGQHLYMHMEIGVYIYGVCDMQCTATALYKKPLTKERKKLARPPKT